MRQMPELKITELPVSELVEYANNAKLHPHEQVDQIASSIQEFGNNDPIAVWHNEDGEPEIVEGHGRVMALRKLGIQTAPVIYLDHLTDEQRRAYSLVHNKLTMNSDFDLGILAEEIAELDSFDMSEFGFALDEEVTSIEEEEETEAEVPFSEELGRENNYIVLKFDTDIDWLNAQTVFGIGQRKRYSTRQDGLLTDKMTSIGIGRVIDGADAINRLLG